jgi:tetratricopeptide (TPR) repeat protein
MSIYRNHWPLILSLMAFNSHAGKWGVSDAEFNYCEAIIGSKFTAAMKEAIVLTHYCRCLVHYEKARKDRSNEANMKANLVTAYNNCKYTISHANLGSKAGKMAVSEVLIQQGKVQKARGFEKEAIDNFKKSIELNPSNPGGYAKLSDIYLRSGKKDLAIWILKEGLKNNPDSRALKRRMERASK